MAWEDYIAVVESDLYEHHGVAKSILSRIAYLIVGPPKEGQEADPNEGWCFATQDYLAANLGCSESEVQRAGKEFVADGWLTTRIVRNKHGHPHKHYRWADGALARIKERKMKKDELGRYIRAKNPKMVNKKSFTANCRETSTEPPVSQPSDTRERSISPMSPARTLQAPYGDPTETLASRQIAGEPHGNLPPSFTAILPSPHGNLPEELDLSESSEQVLTASEKGNPHDDMLRRPLRGDTKASPLDTTRENPGPHDVDCSGNPVESTVVPAPPNLLEEIPSAPRLAHIWPPYRERTGESVCQRPGCGIAYDDWRYLREECQGGAEEAATKKEGDDGPM